MLFGASTTKAPSVLTLTLEQPTWTQSDNIVRSKGEHNSQKKFVYELAAVFVELHVTNNIKHPTYKVLQ